MPRLDPFGMPVRIVPKLEWHNGKIYSYPCPTDQKRGLFIHALMYGTSVFEGIRAYWNPEHQQMYLFRGIDHFERMLRNARDIMKFVVPYTAEQLTGATLDLLRRDGYQQNVYIRPIIFLEDPKIGVYGKRVSVIIMVVPFEKYNLKDKNSLSVCVSSWKRATNAMLPPKGKIGGLYAQSYLAKEEAQRIGFDDAIFLNLDGTICEGSAANLFMVKEGTLYTPDFASNILGGITRSTLMEIARNDLGLTVVETSLPASMLNETDEMFFCGTGAEIEPISKIDDLNVVGNGDVGPITQQLQTAYFDIVYGRNADYENWLVAVYQ